MIVSPMYFGDANENRDLIPADKLHKELSEGNACPLSKEDADNIMVNFLRI